MADFRFSMLVQANAAQAKAEVAAMRAEVTKLSLETAGAGRAAAGASPAVASIGDAARGTATGLAAASAAGVDWEAVVQATRASINPLIAEYQLLGEGVRQAALYEEMGAVSAREAAVAHDQLARWAIDLTGRMEAAGVSIDGTTAAMTRQETAIQQLIARQTGLAASTENSIAAQLQHGHALDAIRAQYDPLFAASREYELELARISEAEREGAISAQIAAQARERAAQQMIAPVRQLGTAYQSAGAYATQLGYQLNDIGVMIAAGQSPLMLAMQQGSQVSQVFGMMRAEGQALGPAIRGSLMSIVSPLSLVTVGVIALGAYAVQAFMGSGDAALGYDDRLKNLNDTMSSLRSNSKLLFDDGLSERFGALQGQARQLLDALVALDRATELKQLRETLDQRFSDETRPSFWQQYVSALYQGQSPGAFADVNLTAANFEALGTALPFGEFQKLRAEIDQLASDGKIDEVTSKIVELGLAMKGKGQFSELGEGAQSLFQDLAKLALGTAETEAIFNGSARRDAGNKRADEIIASMARENELAKVRLEYGEQSVQVRQVEAAQARAALEAEIDRLGIGQQSERAGQMRAELERQLLLMTDQRLESLRKSADQTIAQYAAEQQIAALTAQYGADSLEVAYARAAAEREVMAAQIEAQGFTGQAAADLLAAWDAARGIASVDMASGVGAAAAQARLLAASLGISLQQAVALMGLGGGKGPADPAPRVSWGTGSALGRVGSGTNLTFGDNPGQGGPASVPSYSPPSTGAGSGGGAKAEADALAELVKREREQIAALQALSPLQAEIQRNHDALAKATQAEREEVIALIEERMRLEEVRDKLDEIGRTGEQAFVGMITGAHSFADAISMVLSKLAEMAASEAWSLLWNGASGGGGGLLGLLSGLLGLPAKADGGKVEGPGGPREDNLLHWLSAGEYIVNAHATAANLPLLEAINAGVPIDRLVDMIGGRHMPALADGGLAGAGARAPASWRNWTGGSSASAAAPPPGYPQPAGLQIALEVGVDEDGRWEARVRDIATEASGPVAQVTVEQWSRKALPGRVAQIQSDPRRVG